MLYFTKPILVVSLILASSSLSRKLLLEKLGLPFTVYAPNINELSKMGEPSEALVERLAKQKAQKAATAHSGLIIGSDQIAILEGEILTKPYTHENAVKQLQKSRGKPVSFLTSLALFNTDTGTMQTHVETSVAVFNNLSDTQINHYLEKDRPYGCAGSFKSESLGIALFEKLEGNDPNSLVGLPLIQLVKMLKNEGIDVLTQTP